MESNFQNLNHKYTVDQKKKNGDENSPLKKSQSVILEPSMLQQLKRDYLNVTAQPKLMQCINNGNHFILPFIHWMCRTRIIF